jgi:hypothetical protein
MAVAQCTVIYSFESQLALKFLQKALGDGDFSSAFKKNWH